jgi:uncharacterized protein (TIGR02646 family)
MISLRKGVKPKILEEKGEEWTTALALHVSNNPKVPKRFNQYYSHPSIKQALLAETCQKCAYCECKVTHITYGDIEHILPKSKLPSLTYDWNNLTISCNKCNQYKADYYNPNLPLLNPYTDQPEKQIIFAGPIPISSPGNERATITIRRLRLDRPELIERRQEHITRLINPLIQLYGVTSDRELREEIHKDLVRLNQKDQEFSSMTNQMLLLFHFPA